MAKEVARRTGLQHKRTVLWLIGLAGAAWAGLGSLIFLYNSGQYDFWFPGRVVSYVLLLVAPALTFMPVGRALGSSLYGYWAVVGWAAFLYTLAYVPADPNQGWNANTQPLTILLLSLFMVTVTVSLPFYYRLGFKVFRRKVEQYDISRAVREATLTGLWVLFTAFLRAVGALNLLMAISLLLVFIIMELLVLSRNIGRL